MIQYKCFTVWQDEQEERWLNAMSLKGWHLTQVTLGVKYHFEQGEPKNYIYRLDYQLTQLPSRPDYIQLFDEMGWVFIDSIFNGWQYFRTKEEVPVGTSPEIYTDNESKIMKHARIKPLILGAFILNLIAPMIHLYDDRTLGNASINVICAIILGYALYHINTRIKKLKQVY